jgi:hypothetical protein
MQLHRCHMLVSQERNLVRGYPTPQVPSHLIGPEISPIGQGHHRIAPQRIGYLGVRARGGPEVTVPAQPVRGTGDDVQ